MIYILSAGQFFRDGVKIDVDAQLLHVPGNSPVPVEQRDLWKFMSKSLIGDRQCWTSAYPSSQGAGIVAGTYQDYIVDDLLAIGQWAELPMNSLDCQNLFNFVICS